MAGPETRPQTISEAIGRGQRRLDMLLAMRRKDLVMNHVDRVDVLVEAVQLVSDLAMMGRGVWLIDRLADAIDRTDLIEEEDGFVIHEGGLLFLFRLVSLFMSDWGDVTSTGL